jgi:hypothetical protein
VLVKSGTPQEVQAAINKGAKVNAQNKDGETALMLAAGSPFFQSLGSLTSLDTTFRFLLQKKQSHDGHFITGESRILISRRVRGCRQR